MQQDIAELYKTDSCQTHVFLQHPRHLLEHLFLDGLSQAKWIYRRDDIILCNLSIAICVKKLESFSDVLEAH